MAENSDGPSLEEKAKLWLAQYLPVNFAVALSYPFRQGNWLGVVLMPITLQYLLGAFIWLFTLVLFGLMFKDNLHLQTWDFSDFDISGQFDLGDWIDLEHSNPQTLLEHSKILLGGLLTLPLEMFVTMLLCGFYWRMAGLIQKSPETAEAPSWRAEFFLLDGAKLYLYLFILTFPYLFLNKFSKLFFLDWIHLQSLFDLLAGLILLGGFFLLPFLMAPVVQSASNRELYSLFDIPSAMAWGRQRYVQVMLAGLVAAFMSVTLYVLMAMLTCCLLGFFMPVFFGLIIPPSLHILVQAFGPPPNPNGWPVRR